MKHRENPEAIGLTFSPPELSLFLKENNLGKILPGNEGHVNYLSQVTTRLHTETTEAGFDMFINYPKGILLKLDLLLFIL